MSTRLNPRLKNSSKGQIVMRMASLHFKKANVSDSKSRYGVRCLKGIAVSPHGAIKPVSQRSLTVGNCINIYKPNHLASR
jgi:hypothetical protein